MRLGRVRGAVSVEYNVVVGAVGLACAGAFIALGAAFFDSFMFVRDLVLYPFP